MEKYKRFTEKVDSGFVSELDCRIAYNKLCAIENKIENGKFIELPCIMEAAFGAWFVYDFDKNFNTIDSYECGDKKEAEAKLKELQSKE